MAQNGLRKMGKKNVWGGTFGAPKKAVSINPVEDQKDQKESIQSVYRFAKARSMSSSQKASAVRRKRAAGNPGGKPTNVKTFVSKKNKQKKLKKM